MGRNSITSVSFSGSRNGLLNNGLKFARWRGKDRPADRTQKQMWVVRASDISLLLSGV